MNGRYKLDRGMLKNRMETPKNLHARPMDMNYGGGFLEGMGLLGRGGKGGKFRATVNSIINKIY